MYTMYTRVIGMSVCLVPLLLAVAGCGDDDEPTGAQNAPCAPGLQSMPTGDPKTDPCPQNDMKSMCFMPAYVAVTECCMGPGPNCPRAGTWNRLCQCIPATGTGLGRGGASGGAAGAPSLAAKCGDGEVQSGMPRYEVCDPGNGADKAAKIPSTCSAMMGGSGLLMCDPVTCKYDTSMCTPPNSGGGTGGAG